MDKLHLILKNEWREAFAETDDAVLGKLVKALFAYHGGEACGDLPGEVRVLFLMAKPFLDFNREKYDEKCRALRENGAKGGRPKKAPEENLSGDGKNQMVSGKTKSDPKPKAKAKPKRNPKPPVSGETERESGREKTPAFFSPHAPAHAFSTVGPEKCGERDETAEGGGERDPSLPENVCMTPGEREKLASLYPNKWRELVDHFSVYLANHPEKRYRRHFDTVVDWARRDGVPEGGTAKTYDLDDFFEAAVRKSMAEE